MAKKRGRMIRWKAPKDVRRMTSMLKRLWKKHKEVLRLLPRKVKMKILSHLWRKAANTKSGKAVRRLKRDHLRGAKKTLLSRLRRSRRNRVSSVDLAKAAGLWKRRRKGGRKSRRNWFYPGRRPKNMSKSAWKKLLRGLRDKKRRNPRKPRLGSGGRFKQLVAKLKRRGARSPGALAAWIGREKWGKARFQKMSAAGRRRASRKNG